MRLDLEGMRRTALELGIYLPLGAALAARDLLLSRERLAEVFEELVDRGRETLGRPGGERAGLERISLEAIEDQEELEGGVEERAADVGVLDLGRARPSGRIAPPVADELPIGGYDELTAQQVVTRLAGLSRDELERVRAYEREHRSRNTVFAAIEPLMGELPIQGYDRLTAAEVVRRLDGLSDAELQAIREYETRTRSRSTVLNRIDRLSG
jgi:hypothetical protein